MNPLHDHVIYYFMEIDAEIAPCQLSQSTLHLSPNEYMLQSQVDCTGKWNHVAKDLQTVQESAGHRKWLWLEVGTVVGLLKLPPAPDRSRHLVWNALMVQWHGQAKRLPWDHLEPSWAYGRILTESATFLASCWGSEEKPTWNPQCRGRGSDWSSYYTDS